MAGKLSELLSGAPSAAIADADGVEILQSGANKGATALKIWNFIKSKIDTVFTPTPVTLSISSGLVAINSAAGSLFDLALTGASVTLSNPSGGVDGKILKFRIRQSVSGGTAVVLDTKFRIPSSATTPLAWSTAASKMDIFSAIYNAADDRWEVVSLIPGY